MGFSVSTMLGNTLSASKSKNDQFLNPNGIEEQLTSQNIVLDKKPLSAEDLSFITQSILKLSFVAELSDDIIERLATKFCKCRNTSVEWLFQQGSVANYFFILKEGRVEVVTDGFHARALTCGDSFGELALLNGIRRSSGIKIPREFQTKNLYYVLKKEDFEKIRETVNQPLSQKFLQLLQKHPDLHYLTKREVNSMASVANRLNYHDKERILTRYEMPHALYYIMDGQVRLRYAGGIEVLLGPNEFFGYYGYNSIEYSVLATKETSCYTIGRGSLQSILRQNLLSFFLVTRLKNILITCSEVRQRLSLTEIAELSHFFIFSSIQPLHPLCVHKKQVSHLRVPLNCCEQSPIIGLHELVHGDRVFLQDNLAQRQGFYAEIQTNNFLLFYNQEKKKMWKKSGKYFDDRIQGQPKGARKWRNLKIQHKKQQKFSVRYEVLSASTKDLKSCEKIKQLASILKELNFNMIRSFYQTEIYQNSHCINLEHISGVSIKDVVGVVGPLPISFAKFYLSCLVLAFEYLHDRRIVFRNFAFGSFRVDKFGYVWVYDVLECERCNEQGVETVGRVVGDPHWQPPEVIHQQKYSFGADFWGLGILAYVIVMGYFPFGKYQEDQYTVYQEILQSEIQFPIHCRSRSLKQLICTLLQKDPVARSKLSWGQIKNLQFFRGFEWQKLKRKTLDSPYLPEILKSDTH